MLEVFQRISGAYELQKAFAQFGILLKNTQPLYLRWGVTAYQWIQKNFRVEGGLLQDGPWARLSPNTIAGRRGGSSRILQNTGRLRGTWYWDKTDDDGVWVGTNVEYAKYHEFGTGLFGAGRGRYWILPKEKKCLAFYVMGSHSLGAPSGEVKGKARYAKPGDRICRMKVSHPGVPIRRMLPREGDREIGEMLSRTTITFVKEVMRRVGLHP